MPRPRPPHNGGPGPASRSSGANAWAIAWLAAVADGSRTMSQRTLASVEARGGGLAAVTEAARARGVHLAVIVDDEGRELVAASTHPIHVLC